MYNICNTYIYIYIYTYYVFIQHWIFSRCLTSDARSSRLKGRGLWRSGFNGRIFWDARVNELRHLVGFILLRLLAFLDVFFLGGPGTAYVRKVKGLQQFGWSACLIILFAIQHPSAIQCRCQLLFLLFHLVIVDLWDFGSTVSTSSSKGQNTPASWCFLAVYAINRGLRANRKAHARNFKSLPFLA